MRFELNEVDARRDGYPSIIQFLNLVNALIAEERNISDKGRRYLLLTILSLCLILNILKIKCSPSRFMGVFSCKHIDERRASTPELADDARLLLIMMIHVFY
jgi:hypothetical protein